MKFDKYLAPKLTRGAALACAALAISQVAACGNQKPSTPLPDGAIVVKASDGSIHLDECFTVAGKPGQVFTLQSNERAGFYAGSSHFSVAPQLMRVDGSSGKGFGDTIDLTVSKVLDDLKDGTLTPRTAGYTNPDPQIAQHVTCQEKWPGDPKNVASLVGDFVAYARSSDNPALIGPIDESYHDGIDLKEWFAQDPFNNN